MKLDGLRVHLEPARPALRGSVDERVDLRLVIGRLFPCAQRPGNLVVPEAVVIEKLACVFLGSLVHTAILLAPLAATGRLASAAADWPIVALVVMAGAFYLAELSAMEHAERRARPPARRIDRLACRLALCSCLAVLAVFWTALLERAAAPVSTAWYQALIFPFPLSVGDAVADALAGYVSGRGNLICEAAPGRMDGNAFCRRGEM